MKMALNKLAIVVVVLSLFSTTACLAQQSKLDGIDFRTIYGFAKLTATPYKGAAAIRAARPGER
jgi:hypothetical protein